MPFTHHLLLLVAGLLAGIANGVAGGGSLVSFPALLATGMTPLTANVTSTVGIWPGYLGGAAGFREELHDQRARFTSLIGTTVVGAAAGAAALLATPEGTFTAVVPWLILFACALFGFQPLIARAVGEHVATDGRRPLPLHLGAFIAAAYGAYFGAGLGVVLLAVLSLTIPDRLVRINGLRSVLSLLVNTIAMLFFLIGAPIAWTAAAVMATASLVGGYCGARLSRRLSPFALRMIVVGLGAAAAIKLLVAG